MSKSIYMNHGEIIGITYGFFHYRFAGRSQTR
jgi:hypothetical protein